MQNSPQSRLVPTAQLDLRLKTEAKNNKGHKFQNREN